MKELYLQKESFSKENGDKIESSGGPEEYEHSDRGDFAVEWFCFR